MLRLRVLLLATLVPLAALALPAPDGSANPWPAEIVRGYYYVDQAYGTEYAYWRPSDVTIEQGETVRFESAVGTHRWVSLATPGLGSCDLPCTIRFDTPGSSPYTCLFHDMSGVVNVLDRPDVEIKTPAAGVTLSGTVLVRGYANVTDANIWGVRIVADGHDKGAARIVSGGSRAVFEFDLDTRTVLNGLRTITALAESSLGPVGAGSVQVMVDNPLLPDLVALSIYGRTISSGSEVIFEVHNAGNLNPGKYDVLLQYRHGGAWKTITTITPNGLAPGETRTLKYSWNSVWHYGEFPVRVTLDPTNRIGEMSETNNVAEGYAVFTTRVIWGTDLRDPLA